MPMFKKEEGQSVFVKARPRVCGFTRRTERGLIVRKNWRKHAGGRWHPRKKCELGRKKRGRFAGLGKVRWAALTVVAYVHVLMANRRGKKKIGGVSKRREEG